MRPTEQPEQNNFGALRLLFASLVIISHSPQELDGNFSREPLMQWFHTVSLGDLAVAGFFITSGYLVTASYQSSRSALDYFSKRALRIYPAFIFASLICILIVAPLVPPGAPPRAPALIMDMMSLTPPGGRHEFANRPWSMLDVPMWTIAFEARCYALVAVAGALGALRHRAAMLAITAGLTLLRAGTVLCNTPLGLGDAAGAPFLNALILDPNQALYLTGLFCAGMTFRLFYGSIPLNATGASLCAIAMLDWFCRPGLAGLSLAAFFPYLVFWAALKLNIPLLRGIGYKTDISYGIYLYAWPISWLIILHDPKISPITLSAATMLLASGAGVLSWRLIERPALALIGRRNTRAHVRTSLA